MGGYISKFSALIWSKKEIRILILGLVGVALHDGGARLLTNHVNRTMQERRRCCTG